jgi:hypothetical protein
MTRRRLTKAQLEGVVEVLKRPLRPTPPPKETRAEARLRVDARTEAEARLREHRMSEARWEAYEDPDVGRWRDWKAKRAITEAETRRYLRGEYDPAEEPTSPAQRALVRAARSEDEKAREAAPVELADHRGMDGADR